MPWRKTRPIAPGFRACWFRGTIPRSRQEGYHFPKLQSTVIRESSGAAIAKLGEDFTVTRFVFLNGWNESAEGNHLEPDQRFGVGYLEELRRVRNPVAGEFGWPKILDNGH